MKHLFVMLGFLLSGQWAIGQNFNIQLQSEVAFSGETVANVCGFAKDGHEYAIVGGSQNTHIVDVTAPAAPVVVASIPFSNSLWKEIRVYQHYAYVTTEGNNSGVQIIDLSPLPASTTLPNKIYKGDGVVTQSILTVHALQIDETKGFLYLFGSNIGAGGALVCDLNPDPYNPVYVGQFNDSYIHDGYADNDTLYGAHINEGYFTVIDFTNKNNPVTLATQPTPNTFTHNTWLTDDRKHLLTTDETADSYLTMYDISDLSNITELDRIQCTPGSNSAVHNTYIRGNYAITAWYRDGVNIVDITEPDNMVQTGWYDTYGDSGPGFDGAWGVYPYLPSGNLIVSNIDPGKIFILSPTYVRAAYIEGIVTDAATNLPINAARIDVLGGNASSTEQTNFMGQYKTGNAGSGIIQVTYSKAGYVPQTLAVDLTAGATVTQNIALVPQAVYTVSGTVKDDNGNPVADAQVVIRNTDLNFNANTNAQGTFSTSVTGGTYQIVAGKWGYSTETQSADVSAPASFDLVLTQGYRDPFALDLGWTVSGTSQQGLFEIANPVGVAVSGFVLSPEDDSANDPDDQCMITGNNGLSFIDDDLQLGTAIITSPVMDLSGYTNASLSFETFFFNAGQTIVGSDSLKVIVSNGQTQALVYSRKFQGEQDWVPTTVTIGQLIPLTNNMRIRVEARERFYNTFVVTEAGFDNLVVDEVSSAPETFAAIRLSAQPNPFGEDFVLNVDQQDAQATAVLTNLTGQIIETQPLGAGATSVTMGRQLTPGIYFVQVVSDSGRSQVLKMVRQ
jgi:choice-of-anchor B domain-containing protein